MPWVKMDDKHPEDEKILLAGGDDACLIHYCAICYSSRNLTDGFVPEAALSRLTNIRSWKRTVKALIEVGLFVEVEGGIQIAKYTDHQSTREEVEARRDRNAERQRRHREGKRPRHESRHEGSDAYVTRMSQRDKQDSHIFNAPAVTPPTDTDTPTDSDNGSPPGEDLTTSSPPSMPVVARAKSLVQIQARRAKNLDRLPPEVVDALDELRDSLPPAKPDPDRFSSRAA